MSNSIPAGIPQKQDASEVPKLSRALAPDRPVVDHQAPTKDTPSVAVANTDGNVAAGSVKRQDRAAVQRARRLHIIKMYEQQTEFVARPPNTPYMTTAEMLDKLFVTADKSSK
jgi:hypothetical protein